MNDERKPATIQDIADAAGVSISTVSRVFSGSARVAEEKRRSVMRVAEALNYRPNLFARGLASGQSMTVGVLTQNVGSAFYDSIMQGIITGFAGSGYSPIFADGRWHVEIEREMIQALLGRRVDALIVVGGTLPGAELKRLERRAPVLVVAREVPELAGRCLYTDNFRAAYEATQFLIDAGHRRIAHIAGLPEHQDTVRRRAGYMAALQDAGVRVDERLIIEGNFRQQSGVMAVEALLAAGRTFSAIFAANDQMAFGARLALYRRGIRVPDDVSLVGFDDQNVSAYMTPPLTTVRQPAVEIGEAAAEAVLALLRDETILLPEFRTQLVVRESVAHLR